MKLMIVDDDYQIREGMKLGVDWKKLGIDCVYTCANGVEAFQVFKEELPDIVLVDVQMPGMDGIEMITKIREITMDTKVIFISAYSEFEYCRRALQLGADDYLLKPVQFHKLEEMIIKKVESIKKRQAENDQYLSAFLEKEMRDIYENGRGDGKRICELLKNDYPFVTEGHFFTVVATIDQKGILAEEHRIRLVRSLEERVFEEGNGVVLPQIGGELIILARGNASALLAVYQQTELHNRLVHWNQTCGKRLGTLSAGISGPHDMAGFRRAFEAAREALAYRFYQGGQSICVAPAAMKDTISKEEEDSWTASFFKALQEGSFSKMEEELERWEALIRKERLCPHVFKASACDILRNLYQKERIPELLPDLNREMGECEFLEEVLQTFRAHVYEDIWQTKCSRKETEKYSRMVKQALDYVHVHYGEALTLGSVAEAVGKSTNYFSTVFKKETGVSFTEYLTAYRMEQAKKLLLTTNKKIKEVCETVGYTDYTYFSQVFKQIHGCSASQIRQKEGREEQD